MREETLKGRREQFLKAPVPVLDTYLPQDNDLAAIGAAPN